MRVVIQRVERCSVMVDDMVVSSIKRGFLVLLGVHGGDTEADIDVLVRKCAGLRVFPDGNGRMNLAPADIQGEFLVVSQFTLYGDVRKGLRPYFGDAAQPDVAERYYNLFMARLRENGFTVKGGVFGAHMKVHLINDGPVTIIIDSREIA